MDFESFYNMYGDQEMYRNKPYQTDNLFSCDSSMNSGINNGSIHQNDFIIPGRNTIPFIKGDRQYLQSDQRFISPRKFVKINENDQIEAIFDGTEMYNNEPLSHNIKSKSNESSQPTSNDYRENSNQRKVSQNNTVIIQRKTRGRGGQGHHKIQSGNSNEGE